MNVFLLFLVTCYVGGIFGRKLPAWIKTIGLLVIILGVSYLYLVSNKL